MGSLRNKKCSTQKNLKNKVFYSPSASIYISNVKSFLEIKNFSKSMFGYVHDKFQSIDVDHKEDSRINSKFQT